MEIYAQKEELFNKIVKDNPSNNFVYGQLLQII